MSVKPILYIKTGCPWCSEALDFFKKKKLDLDIRNVTENESYFKEMLQESGQKLAPTFKYGDFIVADFDIAEFKDAVEANPKVLKTLNLDL